MSKQDKNSSLFESVIIRSILFFILAIIGVSGDLFADSKQREVEQNTITVLGLTLPCEKCRAVNETSYEMIIDGRPTIVSTKETLMILLQSALTTKHNSNQPRPEELRQVLFSIQGLPFSKDERNKIARLILSYLFETEKGMSFIKTDARYYRENFMEIVQALIEEGKGNRALWDRFWDLSLASQAKADLQLRTAIAVKGDEMSFVDLLDTLEAKNVAQALFQLEVVEEALKMFGSKWLEKAGKIRKELERCRDSKEILQENNERHCLKILESFRIKAQVLKAVPLLMKTDSSEKNGKWLPFAILGIISFLIGGSLLSLKRARIKNEKAISLLSPEESLSLVEREELRALLQQFNLPPLVEEKGFNQEYRQMLKEFHPDLGKRSSSEFSHLLKKYRRLKELLGKKKRDFN